MLAVGTLVDRDSIRHIAAESCTHAATKDQENLSASEHTGIRSISLHRD